MKCYMLWHGGDSYGVGSIEEDIEEFDSLRAAKSAFASYADHDPYRPCVSNEEPDNGGPSAWIFFYNPNDPDEAGYGGGDPYPDRIMLFGPRGGVRLDYA